MSLQNKLNRFKKQLIHVGSESISEKKQKPVNETVEEYDSGWGRFEAKAVAFEEQHCIIREKNYSKDHKIGHYTVQDLHDAIKRWNEREQSHPLSADGREAADLLFFDTETTGLGSGAGNTIFLLGVARILEDDIHVRQYFLPGPGNEVALYHHFLTDMQDMSNLVTYNGKAFDWPQVKTRHTFVRDMVPKLPPFGHFDLLHGSRRVWKKSFESLRLSIVEKELLSIERTEDTPGYLAPMLYFEYLREKDPSILEGVFKHNELDVLTLISLYTHLSNVLLDKSHTSLSNLERFEIAKWYEALGDRLEAKHRYGELIDTTIDLKAKKALASLYKKEKDLDKAAFYWESFIESEEDVESYVELSKIFEHHFKEFEKALFYARKGYESWKSVKRILRGDEDKERIQFNKRINRILRKLG
ncbi:ribonuclease H-like domain-containing protein [Alkalihalobacillus sp. TS-13]|uniref:ribonuclease H-like domain-containing protein n=1 Tax=Alkalihalobacillus sp. TS-13 TaxID=2842455 RepID=UPI001C872A1B|nr:ribonuclease H-like domain-containing protein [Alkalihalobacillus sp. TS-13]